MKTPDPEKVGVFKSKLRRIVMNHTTRHMTRTAQLQKAHQLARQLGLETRPNHDTSEYQTMLVALTGARSLRRASRADRELVIRTFTEFLADKDARKLHVPTYVSDPEAQSILGVPA